MRLISQNWQAVRCFRDGQLKQITHLFSKNLLIYPKNMIFPQNNVKTHKLHNFSSQYSNVPRLFCIYLFCLSHQTSKLVHTIRHLDMNWLIFKTDENPNIPNSNQSSVLLSSAEPYTTTKMWNIHNRYCRYINENRKQKLKDVQEYLPNSKIISTKAQLNCNYIWII